MTSACYEQDLNEGIQQAKVARDWASRGFSCEMWVDPPDQVWENYVHDTDELIKVVTGMLEIELAGEAHRLRLGDELCIPAGFTHTVRNIGHTTACWLYGYHKP